LVALARLRVVATEKPKDAHVVHWKALFKQKVPKNVPNLLRIDEFLDIAKLIVEQLRENVNYECFIS
jgi:hypothetical protein